VSSRAVVCGLLLACGAAAAQDGLGDPTRPTPLRAAAPVEAAAAPQWRLQSTLVAAQRRVAVINGRTVREGETVDGARLVEVRPDGVSLERAGRTFELTLRAPAVQRLEPTQAGNR